jgi:hypothetical protein
MQLEVSEERANESGVKAPLKEATHHVCLSVCLSACLSVFLSVCLSICLSVRVCVCVCLSNVFSSPLTSDPPRSRLDSVFLNLLSFPAPPKSAKSVVSTQTVIVQANTKKTTGTEVIIRSKIKHHKSPDLCATR